MTILISTILILIISVILAIKAAKKELSVPEEVKRIKVPKGARKHGVIYSSSKSS